jgi:uncharacterized protein (DUF1501 family)
MATTRRQFMFHAGCGALSAAAFLNGLGRFSLIQQALAQSTAAVDPAYKAMVCIFLFGGNDSNNVLIPTGPDPVFGYPSYNAVRGGSQIAIAEALLTPNQITAASHPGRTFGLHPSLAELRALYVQTNSPLAVVANVGTLIQPLTRTQYRAGDPHPSQLFSHSDQQNEWQSSDGRGPSQTGWGGRTVDRTGNLTPGQQFPTIASIAGVTVFTTGNTARSLVLPQTGAINQALRLIQSDAALVDALTSDQDALMPTLVRSAARLTKQAVDNSLLLADDPVLTTVFPTTSLGNQLKQVAKVIKLISANPSFNVKRQIFFASLGGFDTHTNQGNQVGTQASLLAQVSQAMNAFYNATVELSVTPQVTTFTVSDFNRTFGPGGNGTGSDHAWGSNQFVMGGSVIGGNIYGSYPVLALGSTHPQSVDTDDGAGARGRWVPTTAVDQYAATLASWYGLAPGADQSFVFPNISRFPSSNLGFMR